jgi:hypothetical protein
MMLDQDIVAVSPTSVYRVLSGAGLLDRWNVKPSRKGTGFEQPLAPHKHWYIDIAYLNVSGTFYHLCSVLDGANRAIVHWEIRESMKEWEVECVLQRARELVPEARPRVISDNGPQFIAKDFKEFVRVAGMTHVRKDSQERGHPPCRARHPRRGAPRRRPLRQALQRRQAAQCPRLRDPRRLHGRPRREHLGGARPQARGSPGEPTPASGRRHQPGARVSKIAAPRFLCYETILGVRFAGNQYSLNPPSVWDRLSDVFFDQDVEGLRS